MGFQTDRTVAFVNSQILNFLFLFPNMRCKYMKFKNKDHQCYFDKLIQKHVRISILSGERLLISSIYFYLECTARAQILILVMGLG